MRLITGLSRSGLCVNHATLHDHCKCQFTCSYRETEHFYVVLNLLWLNLITLTLHHCALTAVRTDVSHYHHVFNYFNE